MTEKNDTGPACTCGFNPEKHDGHAVRCAASLAFREVPQKPATQIDTGGPAFPWGEHGTHLGGMTIRDVFAAEAMTMLFRGSCESLTVAPDVIASACYRMADAMLKERDKP